MLVIKKLAKVLLMMLSVGAIAEEHREVSVKINKDISVFSDSAVISFKAGKYEFGGNVLFTKNKDFVESEKLIIYKDDKGDISLVASGGLSREVRFKFGNQSGRGKVVEYNKKTGELTITGDGHLDGDGLHISSDRIYYNAKNEILKSGKFNDQFNGVRMKIKI